MVAPVEPGYSASGGSATETDAAGLNEGGTGVGGILSSVRRLVSTETRLLALQAKLTLQQVLVATLLSAAGAAISVLGMIFISLGLFRILVDIAGLQPAWAYLIVGGTMLALTAGLFAVAMSIYKRILPGEKPKEQSDETGPSI